MNTFDPNNPNIPHVAQLARAALDLLQTAQLSGADVPRYVAVNNWLANIAQLHHPNAVEEAGEQPPTSLDTMTDRDDD